MILLTRYAIIKKRYARQVAQGAESAHNSGDDSFAQKLSALIQIPTVSWTDRDKIDPALFRQFQSRLEELFPLVHGNLTRDLHGDYGIIYHWKGRDSSLKPVLFLAHYDVVPAEEKGGEAWTEEPFSGLIKEGELWGRGTLDIKTQLAFQLETAERLLGEGWQPERDIWFAFGGDEEISGREGAQKMAEVLKNRGLRFEFILDEGGVIARDQLAFLKGRPAALIGLEEKGFVTFKISASGASGHSSMPTREGTAIGRLSKGIVRLEKRLFPSRLTPVMRNMLERLVPWVSFPLGVLFANLWLTAPLIRFVFSRSPVTDSLIRTTQAVTVFKGGEQENILPGEATCLVNHRILPGDTIKSLERRHRRTLRDPGLTLEDAGNWPSNDPIAGADSEGSGFRLIQEVLEETHPEVVAVPFLVNGSTDSKYYRELSDQILRFTPLVLRPEDIASIHGVNEKVSLENLRKGLEFYTRLFRRL
ncbi:MAG: M20/M25/M40 family metallo-hydrolase [Spirochaetales bacterium]|nr:M20/M25/M40 family metallo-hydrolase [Spirochaetales bacterium]